MITDLYNRYFQKSRSFLYPALGITKRNIRPVETYLSLKNSIKPEDRKLICLFDHKETLKYEEFERNLLYGNPLYHSSDVTPGEPSIYVFNFDEHKQDWDFFLKGKYSKLSPHFKLIIKNYYGENTPEYAYIDTYLYPEKYFQLYSNLLDIPIGIISEQGELCNLYDLAKETLIYSPKHLEK